MKTVSGVGSKSKEPSGAKTGKKPHLISPHGGAAINLMAGSERVTELQGASRNWLSWDLTPRQVCDLELLLNGGFSPLNGFMDRADYESVCSSLRLAEGALWPIPIMLDVPEDLARKLNPGTHLALRSPEGVRSERSTRVFSRCGFIRMTCGRCFRPSETSCGIISPTSVIP